VYAVVRSGGRQYRVEEGRSIKLGRLAGEPGDTVEIGDVLLMANGEDVTVGAPLVQGARVLATIAEQGRADKIVVFRYKAKTRSRKKTGHRQHFTRVVVDDILAAGQEPKPKKAPEPEPAAAVEEAPKPRRGRRRAAAIAETAEAAADAGTTPDDGTSPDEGGAPEAKMAEDETTTAETETVTVAEEPAASTEEAPAEKPKRRFQRKKKDE
jgi:large subunit ribosomal protein L21